jgi:hypothetical protein
MWAMGGETVHVLTKQARLWRQKFIVPADVTSGGQGTIDDASHHSAKHAAKKNQRSKSQNAKSHLRT